MFKRVARLDASASFLNNNQQGEIMEQQIDIGSPSSKMSRLKKQGAAGITTIVLSVLLGTANFTSAQTTQEPQKLEFLPGEVCQTFGLNIYISGGQNRVYKTFYDRNGNPVRLFEGGRGVELTFENASTHALLKIIPNGSVARTTLNSDGTTNTVTATGHNVIILFGNEPGGPSTIQYVGRLVYTVDSSGVFTIQGFTGKKVDICAILSP